MEQYLTEGIVDSFTSAIKAIFDAIKNFFKSIFGKTEEKCEDNVKKCEEKNKDDWLAAFGASGFHSKVVIDRFLEHYKSVKIKPENNPDTEHYLDSIQKKLDEIYKNAQEDVWSASNNYHDGYTESDLDNLKSKLESLDQDVKTKVGELSKVAIRDLYPMKNNGDINEDVIYVANGSKAKQDLNNIHKIFDKTTAKIESLTSDPNKAKELDANPNEDSNLYTQSCKAVADCIVGIVKKYAETIDKICSMAVQGYTAYQVRCQAAAVHVINYKASNNKEDNKEQEAKSESAIIEEDYIDYDTEEMIREAFEEIDRITDIYMNSFGAEQELFEQYLTEGVISSIGSVIKAIFDAVKNFFKSLFGKAKEECKDAKKADEDSKKTEEDMDKMFMDNYKNVKADGKNINLNFRSDLTKRLDEIYQQAVIDIKSIKNDYHAGYTETDLNNLKSRTADAMSKAKENINKVAVMKDNDIFLSDSSDISEKVLDIFHEKCTEDDMSFIESEFNKVIEKIKRLDFGSCFMNLSVDLGNKFNKPDENNKEVSEATKIYNDAIQTTSNAVLSIIKLYAQALTLASKSVGLGYRTLYVETADRLYAHVLSSSGHKAPNISAKLQKKEANDINKDTAEKQQALNKGVNDMTKAYKSKDADAVIKSANDITKALGGKVAFEDMEGFRKFLDSDEPDVL